MISLVFVYLGCDKSSDNRTEQFPDAGGERHRQSAPERHAGRGAQHVPSDHLLRLIDRLIDRFVDLAGVRRDLACL